jgi:hypothetical protein
MRRRGEGEGGDAWRRGPSGEGRMREVTSKRYMSRWSTKALLPCVEIPRPIPIAAGSHVSGTNEVEQINIHLRGC